MAGQQLTKGQNAPLNAQRVRATLTWTAGPGVPDADIAALLTTNTGKVRSDADFVFYNQPQHSSGSVHHAGKSTSGGQTTDALEVDLGRVEPQIETIAISASADGGTFGQLRDATLRFYDAGSGNELLTFVLAGEGSETAIIAGEIYKRSGQWKFRAVSQGYASGLAGVAQDYGISVDDAPPPAASTAPAAPAQPQSPPAATPVSPQPPAQPGAWPAPPAPAQPGAWPQSQQQPAAAQQGGWPQPPPPAQTGAWPAPPPAQPTAWSPAQQQQAPAPSSGGMVNLDKGHVSLQKRQSVSLTKSGAPPLTRVRMALGWDPARGGRDIDLDASVIAYDRTGKDLAKVWYAHLQDFGGAIRHSGDNLTGAGEGDDEIIYVDLSQLPPAVVALAFTINSYSGQTFNQVARAFCRLVDDYSNAELVRYELSENKNETGVVMAALLRHSDNTWVMQAIAEFHKGKTVKDMVGFGAQVLGLRR
jgi:stress response protein SCP2